MTAAKKREAILWDAAEDKSVRCRACHFRCHIKPGQLGVCRVRQNVEGVLYTLNYDAVCAAHVDPIEKKPLYHYQPGQYSFSIGCEGCNFQCDFCQNWQISQTPRLRREIMGQPCAPEQIVKLAQHNRCRSIAYTYTEPTVFIELCCACGPLARAAGLGNVFVSNGYMTVETIEAVRPFLDAANIDLKSFSDDFYRRICKARLEPVLETLRYLVRQTDVWVEVTTLVVPGLNDSAGELQQIAEFIAHDLGPHVPWHVSRFHPMFERTNSHATPTETLLMAHQIGKTAGLRYVYLGNVPGAGAENTSCHHCGALLIERTGYQLGAYHLINGRCSHCDTPLAGKDLNIVVA